VSSSSKIGVSLSSLLRLLASSTVLFAAVFGGSTEVEICVRGGVFLDKSRHESSSDSLAELSVPS